MFARARTRRGIEVSVDCQAQTGSRRVGQDKNVVRRGGDASFCSRGRGRLDEGGALLVDPTVAASSPPKRVVCARVRVYLSVRALSRGHGSEGCHLGVTVGFGRVRYAWK